MGSGSWYIICHGLVILGLLLLLILILILSTVVSSVPRVPRHDFIFWHHHRIHHTDLAPPPFQLPAAFWCQSKINVPSLRCFASQSSSCCRVDRAGRMAPMRALMASALVVCASGLPVLPRSRLAPIRGAALDGSGQEEPAQLQQVPHALHARRCTLDAPRFAATASAIAAPNARSAHLRHLTPLPRRGRFPRRSHSEAGQRPSIGS